MITLLYSRRHHPGSYLIRGVTWGEWSHVEILLPGGRLLGAAFSEGVNDNHTIDDRLQIASAAAKVTYPGDLGRAMAWASPLIGVTPYDNLGVVGLGFHRDWESEDAYWCSEWAGKFLKEGGFEPFRSKSIKRLTPEHLWMLNYEPIYLK